MKVMTLLMRDQENIEKGREEGMKLGEKRMSELIDRLSKENRMEDILIACADKGYLQKLYEEYNIK